VDTLVALLDAPEPAIRHRAAVSLLDTFIKLESHAELVRRIESLEARGVIETSMVVADGDGPAGDDPNEGMSRRMFWDR
jgi:hypothetical protein